MSDLPPVTLVLGGARSGKSGYAERLVGQHADKHGLERVYIATAEAGDDEMAARIARHRERRGPIWRTVEAPLELAAALRAAVRPGSVVLVDCLTLWISNLMSDGCGVEDAADALVTALGGLDGPVVLVSNEVGSGIVPDNAPAREFRDHAGLLHQRIAALAGRVVLVTAGLAQDLK